MCAIADTCIAFMFVILSATLHVPRHGDAGQVSGGTNNPCLAALFSPMFLLDPWSCLVLQIYAGFMDSWSLCCFAAPLFAGQAPGIRIIRRTA